MTSREIRKNLSTVHLKIDSAKTHNELVHWQRKELELEQLLDDALEREAHEDMELEREGFGAEPEYDEDMTFERLYAEESNDE